MMSSVNYRGFSWIDDGAEHSEADSIRAEVLMRRWSELHHEEEQHVFRMQSDIEDGRDRGYEPDPCDTCGGQTCLGLEGRLETLKTVSGQEYQRRRDVASSVTSGCGEDGCPNELHGIKCPNPDCEDGYDMGPVRTAERARAVKEAERKLDIELIEDKLALIGARPMRPYEHWNEDEAYVQYMEEGRFGDHSR
jgi:hypothetical protein